MSKTEEEKNKTAHYMVGNWSCKTQYVDLSVSIDEDEISVTGTIDCENIDIAFENSNWWVGDYLIFTSNNRFYIQYADEKNLGMGEMKTPGDLREIKWGGKFTRDKMA